MVKRWGMTVPLGGIPLAEHADVFKTLVDAGFTDAWTSEVAGTDAFTPLALAAAWAPALRLGTAIAPVFTRGPGLLAMTAAALAETAPGRFQLGVGASSPVVVGDWNSVPFDRPFARSRDTLRFLRPALAGEMVDQEFETFAVRRFRLERPPATPPPVLLAALRPGMLRLAATEANGVIMNWLAATDVPTALAETKSAATDVPAALAEPENAAAGFDVVARIFVCPTTDTGYARAVGRRMITSYLNVPAYAEFQKWLGRGPALAGMWSAWAAGDRRGALAAIPDEVVDDLIVHGSPAECRAKIQAYADNGIRVPVQALIATPEWDAGSTADKLALITALGA
ncbi:LLM class F420-dependent oxidoreductase [Actinoplanes sp. NPDC049265]|uniref:LLM class F420-dependent oxidoreductase n=1 Tax=Actinoplanes sp. NPDC049265 TaxID=3363902 RepID=UPI00371AAB77